MLTLSLDSLTDSENILIIIVNIITRKIKLTGDSIPIVCDKYMPMLGKILININNIENKKQQNVSDIAILVFLIFFIIKNKVLVEKIKSNNRK